MVNERTAELDSFCKSLVFYSFFPESEEVQIFFDNSKEFYKMPLPKPTYEETFKRYVDAFSVNMVIDYVSFIESNKARYTKQFHRISTIQRLC